MNLGLYVVDGVRRFDFESGRLAREGLDKNLQAAAETEDKVEGGLLLVRRDAFFVLDIGLHIVDRAQRLNLAGDRLTREGLDKDLHTATEMEDKVESRLLLDIVIRKGMAVLELLAGENQMLLIRA